MSNMYEFAGTWNPLRGECTNDCHYCYVKAMKENPSLIQKGIKKKYTGPIEICPNGIKKKPDKDKEYIFVVSMGDLFCDGVDYKDIDTIMRRMDNFPEKQFLIQTKNVMRAYEYFHVFSYKYIMANKTICTTIETDDDTLIDKYSGGDDILKRFMYIQKFKMKFGVKTMITVEPIMKFTSHFSEMLINADPDQINLGADSKKTDLPEPLSHEVLKLMRDLEGAGMNVHIKPNLERLI